MARVVSVRIEIGKELAKQVVEPKPVKILLPAWMYDAFIEDARIHGYPVTVYGIPVEQGNVADITLVYAGHRVFLTK